MKIIKRIFFVLVALVATYLIAALFIKGEYAVEREITINKPKQEIFDYIKFLKNQDNFSKWATMDPNMKKTYSGTDGAVGFISAWESDADSVGKGEQEIKKITEGSRVDFELRFKEPFESTDYAYMSTDAIDSIQTKVKWGFNGKIPYPMNVMCIFMSLEEKLGPDLAIGLSNLKGVMEKE